jgi:hypothetical protein
MSSSIGLLSLMPNDSADRPSELSLTKDPGEVKNSSFSTVPQ